MGFSIAPRVNKLAAPMTKPAAELNSKVPLIDADQFAKAQPDFGVLTQMIMGMMVNNEPIEAPAAKVVEPQTNIEPTPEVSISNYEITAYLLNVREEADSRSKIIDVVKQGSLLQVVQSTDNGWLELKSGGYIHGSYAKLISKEVVQAPAPQTAVMVMNQAGQAPAEALVKSEPSKPSSSVTASSGLTEDQISKIMKDTALEGQGLESAILEIEKQYGINSFFTIAVMKLESGHGKSQLARTKNNLFGLNALDSDAYNKALTFSTKGDSVIAFGHIISEYYIDMGLTSIEKVARKYCGANTNWPSLVKSIMNSDYQKVLT
ncbi:SH3 domain-containing protein [Paenibacillus cremeus]|uniref:SH3 domain-containing protein n=2 Tax=Paenibacillus cremeus TaxID=2163881 RepID=A0A559JM77_9BACL|nr:SH3 domain-containing protein [Paenibacillus cremeus]